MKTNQLATIFISLLFLLNSCEKNAEIGNENFLQKEWKAQYVVNEGKRFNVPTDRTPLKEAYILKFVNDTCFALPTSVNLGGGKYQLASENCMIISDYFGTKKGNVSVHQSNFDSQLLSVFNGAMSYSYTQKELIFRGKEGNEVIFRNIR